MSNSVKTTFQNSKLEDCDLVVGLVATNSRAEWFGGKGSQSVSSGTAYFTARCKIEVGSNGVCRFGWSQKPSTILGGGDCRSMGYGSTGKKSHGNIYVNYGREFFDGDTIGCYINFDEKVIAFSTNGIVEGYAYTRDDFRPSSRMFEEAYFPAYCLRNATAEFNFGATPFIYPQPIFPQAITVPCQVMERAPLTEMLPLDWKYSSLVADDGLEVRNMWASSKTNNDHKNRWKGGVGATSVYSKTAYFEATVTYYDKKGMCRLGWSKRRANFLLGKDDKSVCYGSDGSIHHYGLCRDWGGPSTDNGLVIGCFLDLEKKLISFSRNEVFLGVAFVNSMMEADLKFFERPLYPAFCLRNAAVELNFGATDFLYENVTLTESYGECAPKVPVIDWQYGCHKNEFNEETELFNTQLHLAVYHDKYYLVRQLILRGANVELRNINDRTPLGSAVNTRHYDIALLLLREGKADILAEVEGTKILHLMAKVWKEKSSLRALVDASSWPIDEDFNNFHNFVNSLQRGFNAIRSPPKRNFGIDIAGDGSVKATWERDQSNDARCSEEIVRSEAAEICVHLPVSPDAERGVHPVHAVSIAFAIESVICLISDYL